MNSLRRSLVAASAALAVTVGLVACSPGGPAEEEHTSLVIGVNDLGLYANYGYNGTLPAQAQCDSLLTWMGSRSVDEFAPTLAEEYSLSEDRLTMSIKLREDVDYADGVHLTAETVADYLNNVYNDEGFTFYTHLGGGTEGGVHPVAHAVGEYDLEVTTDLPINGWYMEFMFNIPIMSPSAYNPDAEASALTDDLVCAGPYIRDELVPDVSISFVRNPHYFAPEEYPYDTLKFVVFADNVAALNALKSGQIDATMISPQYAQEALDSDLKVSESLGIFVATLVITDRAGEQVPALADVRVRQAMNMAFDRDAILERINFGYGRATSQITSPIDTPYLEGEDDHYPFDPERAKELLTEAGYPDGFDITIPTAAGTNPQNGRVFDPIVEQSLADIGIRVTFDQLADDTALFTAIGENKYPVVTFQLPSPTVYLNAMFSMLMDEQSTELIDVMDHGTLDEYTQAAQDLGRYMLEDAWFVPITHPSTLIASAPWVEITDGVPDRTIISYQRAE